MMIRSNKDAPRGILFGPALLAGVSCAIIMCVTGFSISRMAYASEQSIADTMVKTITAVNFTDQGTASQVTIHGSAPLTYSAVKHQSPPAVVLYFPDTKFSGVAETYFPKGELVQSVANTTLDRDRPSSRIEISLKKDASYAVTQDNGKVIVALQNKNVSSKTSEASEPAEGATILAPDRPVVPVMMSSSSKSIWVDRVDFETTGEGKSKVTIGTTKKAKFEKQQISPTKMLIKLFNTQIPKFQLRPLITKRFQSAVDRVLPLQSPKMKNAGIAVIEIELREAVPYTINQKDGILVVEFDPSSVPPSPMPEADKADWVQALTEVETDVEKVVLSKTGDPIAANVSSDKTPWQIEPPKKKYTGERISLDFQDADVQSIFRILAEVSGKNFVVETDVAGRATLRLIDVPWDHALELVLQANKLYGVEEDNVIRITTYKAYSEATLARQQVEDEVQPKVTAFIPVNYSQGAMVTEQIKALASTKQGKLQLDDRTGTIMMRDTQAAVDAAKLLTANIDVVTPQVVIEARIVEATSDFSRDLGVQWGAAYGPQATSSKYGNYGTGPQRGFDTIGGTYGVAGAIGGASNYVVNLPAAGPTSGIAFNFARLSGLTRWTLDANLQAMESEGKGRVVSAPRVLTLDNKSAAIQQGTSIPYQVLEKDGYSLKWAEAMLKLEVTPHVTADKRIGLKVVVKNDYPDRSIVVQGAPAITTQMTQTDLLINNSDTVVIGGIIKQEESNSKARVPWFSKLPVLGWMFRSQSGKDATRELLVFISATIVDLEPSR